MHRCEQAALAVHPLVKEAGVRSAARLAEQFRPLVIVTLEPVFAFDPGGFRALARSAGAFLVVVPTEEVPSVELDVRLFSGILEASRRRQRDLEPV